MWYVNLHFSGLNSIYHILDHFPILINLSEAESSHLSCLWTINQSHLHTHSFTCPLTLPPTGEVGKQLRLGRKGIKTCGPIAFVHMCIYTLAYNHTI